MYLVLGRFPFGSVHFLETSGLRCYELRIVRVGFF